MNLLEKLRLTLLVYNLVHKICQDMLPLVTGLKYFKLKTLETMLHVFAATFQNRGTFHTISLRFDDGDTLSSSSFSDTSNS